MGRKEKFTPEEVIQALKDSKGFVTHAASVLGCSPAALYRYRDKYPDVAEVWEGLNDERIDWVESALFKNIKKGHPPSIIFFLKTRGKNRGYIESNHAYLQHQVSGEVKHEVPQQTPEETAAFLQAVFQELDKIIAPNESSENS